MHIVNNCFNPFLPKGSKMAPRLIFFINFSIIFKIFKSDFDIFVDEDENFT